MRRSRRGFTLIELLVVITILVVLLALLAPAMEKAMTAAEMAVCAAQLHAIGTASTSYAMDHKRHYPKRQNNYSHDAITLRTASGLTDIRPLFKNYVALKIFVDPLLPEIFLDEQSNGLGTVIYSNYSVYTGWGMQGFKSINKMGDVFTFKDLRDPNALMYEFNLLAADTDYPFAGGYTTASHPDKDEKMTTRRYQDHNGAGLPVSVPGAPLNLTVAHWYANKIDRGHIDTQFVFDDLSVAKYSNVVMFDDRLASIYITNYDDYVKGGRAQVPAKNHGGR